MRKDAQTRFELFEIIMNDGQALTDDKAYAINKLFATVKNNQEASQLLNKIKAKGYEKELVKSINNLQTTIFTNIANGLASLYYAQTKESIIKEGKNVGAENFFAWQPLGSTVEKYSTFANNPGVSNWIDWMYKSRLNSYTVHLEDDGRFRIHVMSSNPYTNASYHENIYLEPFETVSVYFASKNKFINIEDNTVVMPGIMLAWLIDQKEREVNRMMAELVLTAASFYLGGAAVMKSTGKYSHILNSALFIKSFTDLTVKLGDKDLQKLLGVSYVEQYKKVSNIIDCVLIFKQFADKQINQEVLMLSKAWEEVSDKNKRTLEKNYPDVFKLIQEYTNEIKN